jgi:hypothetical protein
MDEQLLRAMAFNKIQSNVIGIENRYKDWKLITHGSLEHEQINDVLEWFDKEKRIYQYILDLVIKDGATKTEFQNKKDEQALRS